MKEIWAMTVKTSLPETCENSMGLKTDCEAFCSFEAARDALRKRVREFAFSKNSMFDGEGNIIYLKKYAESYENEVYDDPEILDIEKFNYVADSLRDAFSGKDFEFEMENEYCGDYMIAVYSEPGELSIVGEEEGPCNGYDPDIRTNIFSMKEEKNYYLYIDDRFGQEGCTSELYIDLQKAVLN